jgi:hypothetical protein
MALPQGLNFRNTSGYVTDVSPATFEIFDPASSGTPQYPRTTAQGNTVGYETGSINSNPRNRNSGNDARIAGCHSMNSATQRYRIDLPATGSYNIRSASGDGTYSVNAYLEVLDTTSSLGVLVNNASTGIANSFYDASGTLRTALLWPTLNTAVSKTFTTTICRFKFSTGSSSSIAHLYIESASSGSSGTVATTNANDTSSASGTTTVTGTLARTNANDTATASGAVGSAISGTVASTNANDASAASGTTAVVGTSASTNANDVSASSGTTTVAGTVARTNANDTATASGIAGAITGTADCTNNADTCSAVGVSGNPTLKVGGDDYPEERIEVWEAPRKPKKHDEKLDSVMRAAMDKAMGRQPKTAPVIAKAAPIIEAPALVEYDEEDDEETLLLLL